MENIFSKNKKIKKAGNFGMAISLLFALISLLVGWKMLAIILFGVGAYIYFESKRRVASNIRSLQQKILSELTSGFIKNYRLQISNIAYVLENIIKNNKFEDFEVNSLFSKDLDIDTAELQFYRSLMGKMYYFFVHKNFFSSDDILDFFEILNKTTEKDDEPFLDEDSEVVQIYKTVFLLCLFISDEPQDVLNSLIGNFYKEGQRATPSDFIVEYYGIVATAKISRDELRKMVINPLST